MKYRPHEGLAHWLGAQLAHRGTALCPTTYWSHIVPIPSHPKRLSQRGFDQAMIFAEHISEHIHIPIARMLLVHMNTEHPQTELAHERRFRNSRLSLSLRSRPLPGARILLVDDVVTTGASSRYSASLLRHAGAARVDLLSVSRATAWEKFRHAH